MMKEAADPNRRPRTTSEGTPLGQGRRVVNPGVSGSPLSPSPGSYIRQVLGQFLNLRTFESRIQFIFTCGEASRRSMSHLSSSPPPHPSSSSAILK